MYRRRKYKCIMLFSCILLISYSYIAFAVSSNEVPDWLNGYIYITGIMVDFSPDSDERKEVISLYDCSTGKVVDDAKCGIEEMIFQSDMRNCSMSRNNDLAEWICYEDSYRIKISSNDSLDYINIPDVYLIGPICWLTESVLVYSYLPKMEQGTSRPLFSMMVYDKASKRTEKISALWNGETLQLPYIPTIVTSYHNNGTDVIALLICHATSIYINPGQDQIWFINCNTGDIYKAFPWDQYDGESDSYYALLNNKKRIYAPSEMTIYSEILMSWIE